MYIQTEQLNKRAMMISTHTIWGIFVYVILFGLIVASFYRLET